MDRAGTIAYVIAGVLQREGGINDVGDGKGVTRYGQTDDWLAQYGLPVPKSADDAAVNYRTWLALTGLEAVCEQPDSFTDAMVDWAVHSGAAVPVRTLQRTLGVTADGVIGPQTRAALQHANRERLARRMLAERAKFLGRLITDAPDKHARYAAGWMARLAVQIEALA